jgi:hypothetical protein
MWTYQTLAEKPPKNGSVRKALGIGLFQNKYTLPLASRRKFLRFGDGGKRSFF